MSEDYNPIDLDAINLWSRRMFAKLRKEFDKELSTVLTNTDGMARVRAISDEDWQAAVDAEQGED